MKYWIIVIGVILISCQKKSEVSKASFEGKWKYYNSQNEYSEFWFTNDCALQIDETAYNIELYKYSIRNDSLILSDLSGKREIYSLEIKDIQNSEISLKNDFVSFKMSLFSESEVIDTTTAYFDKVYAQFGDRVKSQKK